MLYYRKLISTLLTFAQNPKLFITEVIRILVFLKNLDNLNLSVNSDNPHENYVNLSETFSKAAQKHLPIKSIS